MGKECLESVRPLELDETGQNLYFALVATLNFSEPLFLRLGTMSAQKGYPVNSHGSSFLFFLLNMSLVLMLLLFCFYCDFYMPFFIATVIPYCIYLLSAST